jgi:hypothetical protein
MKSIRHGGYRAECQWRVVRTVDALSLGVEIDLELLGAHRHRLCGSCWRIVEAGLRVADGEEDVVVWLVATFRACLTPIGDVPFRPASQSGLIAAVEAGRNDEQYRQVVDLALGRLNQFEAQELNEVVLALSNLPPDTVPLDIISASAHPYEQIRALSAVRWAATPSDAHRGAALAHDPSALVRRSLAATLARHAAEAGPNDARVPVWAPVLQILICDVRASIRRLAAQAQAALVLPVQTGI